MSAQHTPAPWTVSGKQVKSIDHGKRYTVATANNPKFTDEANASNACLIAAAPDLLAAARCALADFEGILPEFDPEREHPAWETLAELRAAITKATGETA